LRDSAGRTVTFTEFDLVTVKITKGLMDRRDLGFTTDGIIQRRACREKQGTLSSRPECCRGTSDCRMIHDPPEAEVPRLRYTPLGMTGVFFLDSAVNPPGERNDLRGVGFHLSAVSAAARHSTNLSP
jgi:hypothetical protein